MSRRFLTEDDPECAPPAPMQAEPTWECIGKPMVIANHDITPQVLEALAAEFAGSPRVLYVGVAEAHAPSLSPCGIPVLGCTERMEMRGAELWALIHWIGETRPPVTLYIGFQPWPIDPVTGERAEPRIVDIFARPAENEPVERAC